MVPFCQELTTIHWPPARMETPKKKKPDGYSHQWHKEHSTSGILKRLFYSFPNPLGGEIWRFA